MKPFSPVINENLMLYQNNAAGTTHTELVDAPSLETLEVRDGALSNLIQSLVIGLDNL